MKKHVLAILLCALSLQFPGCDSAGPTETASGGSGTETVGIMGVFVTSAGDPVAGADVVAFGGSGTETVGSTVTDLYGAYLLKDMPQGTFRIEANFNDSALVALLPAVAADSITYIYKDSLLHLIDAASDTIAVYWVRTDTMYAPGSISGTVTTKGTDHSSTHVFIPGTSFGAWTDVNGDFVISGVPPGIYTLRYERSEHTTVETRDVVVHSGQDTPLLPVVLERDPASPPPAPQGLSATYDTLSGAVLLRWRSVDVSDLGGYRLYLDTGTAGPVFVSETIAPDTTALHVVFSDLLDTSSHQFRYQVRAFDTLNDMSGFSQPVSVQAVSPTRVRTGITITSADSVHVGQPIQIVASCVNPSRRNQGLRWYIGARDSAGLARTVDSIDATALSDTLVHLFDQIGAEWFFVEVTDDGGAVWVDSVRLTATGIPVPHDTCFAGPPLAIARRHLAAASAGQELYAIGGQINLPTGGSMSMDVMEVYGTDSGWRDDSSLAIARYGASVAAAGDTLYLIGGSHDRGDFTTIEAYDCVNRRWFTHGTAMPSARQSAAACTYNGRIYVSGGIDGFGPYGLPTLSNRIDEFDPRTGTWRTVAYLQVNRCYHQMVEMAGKLYVIGGVGGPDSLWTSVGDLSLSSVEIFDPAAPSVSWGPALPYGRSLFGAAVIDSVIYVLGGLTEKTGGQCLSSVASLSSQSGPWRAEKPLPMAVQNHATCVLGQAIYVIGGTQTNVTVDSGEQSRVWIYYP